MKPFYMTLTGTLERDEDNSVYLKLENNTRFAVTGKFKNQESIELDRQQWEVIPNTDSQGAIATVQIIDKVSEVQAGDRCELIGRVVQLGKRNSLVLLKVSRPEEKTLKITLIAPPANMKTGQLWQVIAKVEANYLEIVGGQNIEETANSPELPPEVTLKRLVQRGKTGDDLTQQGGMTVVEENFNQIANRVLAIAKKSLAEKTGISTWKLGNQVQREQVWEWEAISIESADKPLKARVQVNAYTEADRVYVYPQYDAEIDDLADSFEQESLVFDDEIDEIDRQPKISITDRLIVTPLGAARSIGASCFRVEIGPYEIVLDAGTRPKGSNPLPAFEYLTNPNLILITHAHQDHIGALPVFHNRFPLTRMICTPGTREIAHIMLTDCLKVQQANEDFEQLFDEVDLEQTLFKLEIQSIGVDFEPLPGLKVRFIHAGHIVGAACVYLQYGNRSLLYTGDYNTTSSRTTDGLRLADLPEADILITESTYGADTHPSRKAQETELLQAVAEVVQKGGNVLIPAFALGRAQEILLAIRTSAIFHSSKIPVYIDGLVRGVTEVFTDNLKLLPTSVQNFSKVCGQEPFLNPNGVPPIIAIAHPRERPLAIAKPSVIIASSGMLTGGASVYYGQALLERENAAIFISGYTDEESPGRFLQSLQKEDVVEIEGKKLTVRATIRRFNLSAHADKVGLTQVIHRVNPRHLILIHGSINALHELSKTGDLQDKYIIHIPEVGEAIAYGTTPEHISTNRLTKIDSPQEFEVTIEAEAEGAWLRIPEAVLEDPRWISLSTRGTIKAKWSGAGLYLIAISDRTIAIESAIARGEDCCAVCQFFDKKKNCQCPDSPLFSRSVDPRAYCAEFVQIDKK